MSFTDPFWGYTILLRTIVYVLIPLFGILQFVRLRLALHVFQLEGYKRREFLAWCRANRQRARFLTKPTAKKPLVMTGRAWRILVTATIGSVLAVLVVPGVAHLFLGGWPADIGAWAVMTALVFFATPRALVLADQVMTPVQATINGRFRRAARTRLTTVAPLVVGVTGSFGKTSTKFAIERLIGPGEAVLATPGSFNTPLGVARTINEHMTDAHRFFIVEMGAYGTGEIAELCRFVHPRIGVLTAIGPAHLERFGSMEAIRRGKYELVEALPDGGAAVMNVDDLEVRALADKTTHVSVVRYGLQPEGSPDISAREVDPSSRGTAMTIVDSKNNEELRVTTRLLGRHALGHVLAAAAVALASGRSLVELKTPIESLQPVDHRLQIIDGTGGITVIDDAYNSNPEGAAAALEVLGSMPGKQKIVVTPGIVELGPLQQQANEVFGERAGRVADILIVVARVNRDAITAGAARSGKARIVTVDSLNEAQKELATLLRAGDVVLFENDLPDQYED